MWVLVEWWKRGVVEWMWVEWWKRGVVEWILPDPPTPLLLYPRLPSLPW